MMLRVILAAGCALAAVSAAAAAPLAADTPSTTAWGVGFTAPKEWSLTTSPGEAVLTAPEGDVRVAVVDAGAAPDAPAAVAAAWKVFDANEHHALKVTSPHPGREGWDASTVFEYETSPTEHLLVEAVAYRKGASWTVLIVSGGEATLEKREASAFLVQESLRPAGYAKENFAGRTPHQLDAEKLAALRTFLEDGARRLRVPGVGYAILQDGKILYEGGVGVRDVKTGAPVDAHTRFMIASNTKGMSTLLLARLADQGKLKWDEKVTDVYPDFRLGSPETTAKVEMRHLVCACTGVPRKDFEWVFNASPETPASTTFTQLAATEPTSKFGEVFQYNNLMASAAGYIGGHLLYPQMELGAAYDRAMQEQIFDPLGMADTTFDYHAALSGDHAAAYADTIDGTLADADVALNSEILPYRPAGGAWSSPHDMIAYVRDELNEGKLPNGEVFVSRANLLERRKPSVPIGEDQFYGMGLMTDARYGVMVVHHGGDLVGYHSDWFAITSANVGAVILTNGDNGYRLRGPFRRRLLELLYDGKPEAAGDVAAAAAQIDAETAKERPFLKVPPDPGLAANLASHYVSPDLGHITVSRSNCAVVFDFGTWKSSVASRKNDDGTVAFVTVDPGDGGSAFEVGTKDGKRALTIRDGQHVYVYVEG
jgi:CubicO group peptidase (beta-lactamase class C family)